MTQIRAYPSTDGYLVVNTRPMAHSPRHQLLDALWEHQTALGFLSDDSFQGIARQFDLPVTEVRAVASFYHFFHEQPAGRFTIYLDNSILAQFAGMREVRKAFEEATGARIGEVSADGLFGLYETPCIGLSDQPPAALINFQPFTHLSPPKVRRIITALREGQSPAALADTIQEPLYHPRCLRKPFLTGDYQPGASLKRLQQLASTKVLSEIRRSGLSGMGGALFSTGRKWSLARTHEGPRVIITNADEGEPGTFKDRFLLDRFPGLVLEGMIIAGYAIGAEEGIIYLRAEYQWLLPRLKSAMEELRKLGWLGDHLPTLEPHRFSIRIQVGAGAYVCGEETALIESLEGKRGQPRSRHVYPVECGYLGRPTVVNNVETLAMAARVMEKGAPAFRRQGTADSPGVKLLCISGDCDRPGIYEVPWGVLLGDILEVAGAHDPNYVQVSGPSGVAVGPAGFSRQLAREDLPTNGTLMVFSIQRDLATILLNYNQFFRRESCGACLPCRSGNQMLGYKLAKLQDGRITEDDLNDLHQWGNMMHAGSRCGLGKFAAQAIQTALLAFPEYFQERVHERAVFDLNRSVQAYHAAVSQSEYGQESHHTY